MILENYLRKAYAAQQIAELCGYLVAEDETPEHIVNSCAEKTEGPILEKIREISKLMESEDTSEISDEELDAIVKSISDDDILDEYDENELKLVDEETGEIIDIELPEEINEVLSRQERMKAKIRFARTASKRAMKEKIALHKHSDKATINRRARRLAIKALKAKLAKKSLGDMSVTDKERVEKILSSRKTLINRLAMKMVPRVRQLEKERLS